MNLQHSSFAIVMREPNYNAEGKVSRPTAGRPKDGRKNAAILAAALENFLTHGFERASMDAIAQAADVSKLTVYSHFQNKENLFREVIAQKCTQFACEEKYAAARQLPVEEGLNTIALAFLQMIALPETLSLYRVVISECIRHPKLAEMFYEAGPVQQKQAFLEYLRYIQTIAPFRVDNEEQACDHFFSLLRGCVYMRLILRLEPQPTQAELAEHAEASVKVFLRATI